MIIYDHDGSQIPFKKFIFPDGQPHLELLIDGHLKDGDIATIETAIRNPDELFQVVLACDSLYRAGYQPHLDIRYLMGARMDRPINNRSPFTLEVVAEILGYGANCPIRILDPHSDISLKKLNAKAVYPTRIVDELLKKFSPDTTVLVSPDRGALARFPLMTTKLKHYEIVHGSKIRDISTGHLTAFNIDYSYMVKNKNCLILDDICDGGGTFAGLASILNEAGASRVDLFVTHGIFSKTLPIPGIKSVFTTDSFSADPICPWWGTRFPISMQELRSSRD